MRLLGLLQILNLPIMLLLKWIGYQVQGQVLFILNFTLHTWLRQALLDTVISLLWETDLQTMPLHIKELLQTSLLGTPMLTKPKLVIMLHGLKKDSNTLLMPLRETMMILSMNLVKTSL